MGIFAETLDALEADSEVGVNAELRRPQAKMDAVKGISEWNNNEDE